MEKLLNTYILTKLGYKKMEDIINEKKVLTEKSNISQKINLNLCNKYGDLERVRHIKNNGKMKTVSIKVQTGIHLEVPSNYILYVLNKRGYFICKRAGELEKGDILISRNGDNFANNKPLITMNDSYLLGNLYSLNFIELINVKSEYIEITPENESMKELLIENLSEHFDISVINNNIYISNNIANIEKFVKKYNMNQRISKLIINSNIQTQKSFLKGFFDINSIIKNKSIRKKVNNKDLITEIQLMLKNIGIIAETKDDEIFMRGKEIVDFYNHVGFNNNDYEEALLNVSLDKTDFYIIPNIKELIEAYYHSIENKVRKYNLKNFEYTRENIYKLLELRGNRHLKDLILMVIDDNICYDEILEIDKVDRKQVYDFDMAITNTYIIKSFIINNTP